MISTIAELQLTTRLPDRATAAGLVESWFAGGLGTFVGGWSDVLSALSEQATAARLGNLEVGHAVIELYARYPGGRSRSFRWSVDGFHRFLDYIASGANGKVNVRQPRTGSVSGVVNIDLTRHEVDPEWVYFTATFEESVLADADQSDRLMRLFELFAGIADPSFGQDAPMLSIHRTALESLLRQVPDTVLLKSREILRGYSWLTICSEEIGDRLGGESALRAAGVFCDVKHLPAGGYWLLATPVFADFNIDVADRIFPVLAPVLPAGMPMDPSEWSDSRRYIAVLEDASLRP